MEKLTPQGVGNGVEVMEGCTGHRRVRRRKGSRTWDSPPHRRFALRAVDHGYRHLQGYRIHQGAGRGLAR